MRARSRAPALYPQPLVRPPAFGAADGARLLALAARCCARARPSRRSCSAPPRSSSAPSTAGTSSRVGARRRSRWRRWWSRARRTACWPPASPPARVLAAFAPVPGPSPPHRGRRRMAPRAAAARLARLRAGARQPGPAGRAARQHRAVARPRPHRAGRGRADPGQHPREFARPCRPARPASISSTSSRTRSAASIERVMATPGASDFERVPMLRGRITRMNGVPVEQIATAAGMRLGAARRPRHHLVGRAAAGRETRRGRMVAGGLQGRSVDLARSPRAADAFGLKLGDTITVNVLGREVTGKHRQPARGRLVVLTINFVMVFSPGMLEGAPQTHHRDRARAGDEERPAGTGSPPSPTSRRSGCKDALDRGQPSWPRSAARSAVTARRHARRRHPGAGRRGRRRPAAPGL